MPAVGLLAANVSPADEPVPSSACQMSSVSVDEHSSEPKLVTVSSSAFADGR